MDNKNDDYLYILKEHGYKIEVLCDRLEFWCKKVNITLDIAGIEDSVHINNRLFFYMICDYFADIIRLKEFHPVENANIKKIFAYSTFWFLRRKPVQVIGQVEDKNLYINEKIAVVVIISLLLDKIKPENSQYVLSFAEHLLYHFKYRNFNAQTIELMIDGFMTGYDIATRSI